MSAMADSIIWGSRLSGPQSMAVADLMRGRNERNWRKHTGQQRAAMRRALREVGVIERPLVSKRTGRLLDGELRVEIAAELKQERIDVDLLDVDEEEERIILATLDLMRAEAGVSPERWIDLRLEIASDDVIEVVTRGEQAQRWTPPWMGTYDEDDWGEDAAVLSVEDYDCIWVRVSGDGAAADDVLRAVRGVVERHDGVQVDAGRR